jgi:hypothetical protein
VLAKAPLSEPGDTHSIQAQAAIAPARRNLLLRFPSLAIGQHAEVAGACAGRLALPAFT